ncbi:MAG: C39 family peptidase [Muribaculaceae bacterium]|nr:C39 family peptidase [Roseburia sp.]MCM1431758.1 C39 family peptidase [Muribaculaceae bacterium]MCM1493376.1 C39 family peptidase [Muribaculaceae bacterium]
MGRQNGNTEIDLVTWNEEARQSESRKRRLREARRRRRRRRQLVLTLRFLAAALVLVLLVSFVRGRGIFKGRGGFFAGRGSEKTVSYAKADEVELAVPTLYEGNAIREKLRGLADSDKAYEEIYENYDAYPEALMAALCSSSELLPYVQGYLTSDGQAHGAVTDKELAEAVPLFLQWDSRWGYASYGDSSIALSGCAPTCLSMVIVGLTGNAGATPAAVAEYAWSEGYYLEGTGTSWAIMTEGCKHFGVVGTELALDESVVRRHLQNGEPIICSMRPGDFTTGGHFIVLTEIREDGIVVHDPNSEKRSGVLWSYDTLAGQIKNLWGFTTV